MILHVKMNLLISFLYFKLDPKNFIYSQSLKCWLELDKLKMT